MFSAIHINIKTITVGKVHCCWQAPVNWLQQFFCNYFYNSCFYFAAFNFLFPSLIYFVVTIYLSPNFFRLYVYFLSIYINRTTHLGQENLHEKKVVQFFENSIVYE